MLEKKKDVLESDKRLLQFRTYDEYLDFLVSKVDVCYFRNYLTARKLAELGYRSSGDMLTKEEFYKKVSDVMEALYHSRKPYELCSLGLNFTDVMYNELAVRERWNRIGLVATIIFIRYQTKEGYEISGYIDYADRLVNENWGPFFKGKKKLRLRTSDLSFFNWRNKKAYRNDSSNFQLYLEGVGSITVRNYILRWERSRYCRRFPWTLGQTPKVYTAGQKFETRKVVFDEQRGFLFQHKHDRKLIYIDPYLSNPGQGTYRERIFTKHFDHFVLYDHYVRKQS